MRYLIVWNAGYGEMMDAVEAENQKEADKIAYEYWREGAENKADYRAEPLTKDNAKDYGLEDELDE